MSKRAETIPLQTAKVPFFVQSARYEWKASASSQLLLVDSDLFFFSSISASTRGQERIILVGGVKEMVHSSICLLNNEFAFRIRRLSIQVRPNYIILTSISEYNILLSFISIFLDIAIGSVDKRQLETIMAHGLTLEEAVDVIVRGYIEMKYPLPYYDMRSQSIL